ncbi:GDSL-type esterase/lipase family protein [Methylobacterium brachythecii]|uniref:Lysophospholipase L1-like esterase n=1 Tax=Methylobacterium brachythecii TaxID=1176177 RepID=A0A7W6AMA3_9HYPH|nr:GDSL-type esterase/lipase family protein [Methylobacterium brachythecii]MBB3903720.1 lysophospholipase L1-like esterase [Methylobacterium brachythecii]GLS44289.1 hypothetical protein GCM10007884_22770 [Methylobacterium brachythecii]
MSSNSPQGALVRFLTESRSLRGLLAVGVVATAAKAVGAAVESRRNTQLARIHLGRRLPVIRAELAAAQPGFLFLAGNSHAECGGLALAQSMPLVNGGIGGASARGYARQLGEMPVMARAGVAVLFVGSNDIMRRASPLSEKTRAGFVVAVGHILEWLRANADVVLVAAVPPLGPEAVAMRDPAAVTAYGDVLRRLSVDYGCRFIDPFATLRDGADGTTTHACADGVHLRDYEAWAAEFVSMLRGIGEADRPPFREQA